MRLDKFLARTGQGSRKEVKSLLKDHLVSLNGIMVTKPDLNIDEHKDIIKINDKIIKYQDNYYFLLNKPKGYLSSTEDSFCPTVIDLLPEYSYLDLFPVGRLDKDTTGVLIITTDGEMAHQLISPKYHVDKVYLATLDKEVNPNIKNEFENGIMLDNELTLPAKLEIIDENICQVTLHQGKYHQVKRMFEHFGYKVTDLKRIKFKNLTLDNLKEGEYRELTDQEIASLKEINK